MEFSFSIGDTVYEIPEVINLQLFERALAWDITEYKNLKPFVSTITECPLSVLSLLDKETFELIIGLCLSRMEFNEITTNISIGQYKLKPFDDFTFGDFMDLDILLSGGGITSNASQIVSKLYSMPIEEAYTTDIKEVYGTLMELARWRADVLTEYTEFFGEPNNDEDRETIKHTQEQLQFMWYEAVIVLSDNNFLNIAKVVERPYKEALNYLTYKKYQADKSQLEQLKRKNDLQRRTR